MARVVLTSQQMPGPYPANGIVSPGDLALPFTVADPVNGHSFIPSGRDLILVWNSDVAPQTFTLLSMPDSVGRLGDFTYSVPAGTVAMFMVVPALWSHVDGIELNASSANLKLAILRV